MYTNIRNYIWEFKTVERLANLEIAVYTSFPDVSELKREFSNLYQDIKPVLDEDEEFAKSVKKFKEVLDNITDDFYFKIDQVQEVSE